MLLIVSRRLYNKKIIVLLNVNYTSFHFNRILQVFLKKVHKISIVPEKPPTHTLR